MPIKSIEEATAERWQALLQTFDFAPFGSLWRVDESVWKGKLPDSYDKANARRDHPGCSIRRGRASLSVVAPMLHGTSSKSRTQSTICVNDIYGEPHMTYFGGLDPVPISLSHFRNKTVVRAAKGTASPNEMQSLDLLCNRKGW